MPTATPGGGPSGARIGYDGVVLRGLSRSASPRVVAFVLGCFALLAPSSAHAHPLVDEGEALLAEAQFADALERFERAAQSDDLRREDVLRMLEGRALAHRALGDDAAMAEHLLMLAALDPTHTFPDHVPPEVQWRFRVLSERSPGRLRVRVGARFRDGEVTLTTALEGDPGGLVRSVSLSGREPGGEWHGATDGDLTLPVGTSRELEYHVTVVGPGGAPLVEQGSAATPLPLFVVTPAAPVLAPPVAPPPPPSTVEVWPFVLGGALAVVAIGAVVTTVVLTMPESDRTVPTGPVFAVEMSLRGGP